MWDRDPSEWGTGTLALLYGIAVRDAFPDQFFDAHLALFAARHDKGLKLGHEDVLRDAVAEAGLDPDAVAEEVAQRPPAQDARRRAHRSASTAGRCSACPPTSRATRRCSCASWSAGDVDDLERMLDLLQWSRLNEFKRTRIPR